MAGPSTGRKKFPCGIRVLFVFSGIAVLVALFAVPVRRIRVTEHFSTASNEQTRRTTLSNETILLPVYLAVRGVRTSPETGLKVTTTLRTKAFAAEIGGVILLGLVSGLSFCVLRKSRRT